MCHSGCWTISTVDDDVRFFVLQKEEEEEVVVVEALIGAELEEEDLASDEDGRLETSFW